MNTPHYKIIIVIACGTRLQFMYVFYIILARSTPRHV